MMVRNDRMPEDALLYELFKSRGVGLSGQIPYECVAYFDAPVQVGASRCVAVAQFSRNSTTGPTEPSSRPTSLTSCL